MSKRIIMALGGFLFLTSIQVLATDLTFSHAHATTWQHPNDFPGDRNNYAPSLIIDGNPTQSIGWGIYPAVASNQAALLTLARPLAAGSKTLIIKMYFYGSSTYHLLGDFSLGYTTAKSPTLSSSEKTFTNIISASTLNGSTLTYNTASGQFVDTGVLPETEIYTIKITENSDKPITGIFINTIPNEVFPYGGSGRGWTGNFQLTGVTVDEVCEPEE